MATPSRLEAATGPTGSAQGEIRGWRMLLFALPAGPHAFIVMPLMIVVPSFYAANTAVTTAQVALIVSIGRVFDAVIDPFLGYLSDRTRSRFGPRKPWMLAAVLICPPAIWFLYQPPREAAALYFIGWSFLLYVGTSIYEITRGAWTAELTRDYIGRSRLVMATSFFNICGSLSFWLLPLLLSRTTGTTAITGQTLSTLSGIYLVVMPTLVLLTLWLIPIGVPQPPQDGLSQWRSMWLSLRLCRPLWHYLAAIGCWALGQGTFMTLIYAFMTEYMRMGEQFPTLMLSYFVVQLAVMPIWARILKHVDRHRAWAVGLAVDAIARLLLLLLPVGPEAFIPALAIVVVTASFSSPCNFLPTALLADVVDYNTLKTRSNQAGRFISLNSLAIKIMQALGAGVAFGCLALSDFEIGKPNAPGAEWGLLMGYLFVPSALLLCAALLAWRFPLGRRGQQTVRRRLDRMSLRTSPNPLA